MSIFNQFSSREINILQERARRVAATSKQDDNIDIITGLTVHVGDELYFMPIDELTAVYENVNVVPVPCVPDYVQGIANIRGHILPVLNLASLLNSTSNNESETTSLIVSVHENTTIAFRVDAIGEVNNITKSQISSTSSKAEVNQDKYVIGVLPDGRAVLSVVNLFKDSSLIINDVIN